MPVDTPVDVVTPQASSKRPRCDADYSRKKTHRLALKPQGGGPLVVVTLTGRPCTPELCAITCEDIGSPDAVVPFAPSNMTPLKAHPHLSCAALSCGHRFHASALLVHFMRNSLTCPLCRSGASTLPTKASLPIRKEPWFRETHAAITRDIAEAERLAIESDQAMAREYVMEQTQTLLRVMPPHELAHILRMDDVTVTATFFFYRIATGFSQDSDQPIPLLGMTMPLNLVLPRYNEEVPFL